MLSHQEPWGLEALQWSNLNKIWTHCQSAHTTFACTPEFLYGSGSPLSLARQLCIAAKESKDHVEELDRLLTGILECSFDQTAPATVDNAIGLLKRLPRYPLELPVSALRNERFALDLSCLRRRPGADTHFRTLPSISSFYANQDPGNVDNLDTVQWPKTTFQRLRFVHMLDACTMRLALVAASSMIKGSYEETLGRTMLQYLDKVAEVMDFVAGDEFISRSWSESVRVIVLSYLWSVWHRSTTVYLSWVLWYELQMQRPWSTNMLSLHYTRLFEDAHFRGIWARGSSPAEKPQYMCAWALQLLLSSPASLAFDFRNLYQRFDTAHSHKPQRCNADLQKCDGSSPEVCGRFREETLMRANQSVHDGSCKGCRRLPWDKSSYDSVTGGRAVDFDKCDQRIKFCRADHHTLAVTHVTSHGHGGVPSEGINLCLHKRFSRLARNRGCPSYWIDTVCIPEDNYPDIRKEAIDNINPTFEQSKVTVVCDQDLMSLEFEGGDRHTPSCELLLATLLVSDWSVRAWTVFEGIRGSRNLHILCANNHLVNLQETIRHVLERGALDLAVLALAARQILPCDPSPTFNIAESAALLSHRIPRRATDDITIWSLMTGNAPKQYTNDVERFWQSRIGERLNTGYLMSSAPRTLKSPLKWAPCSPNVRSKSPQYPNSPMNTYSSDGEGSEVGIITEYGLLSVWLGSRVPLDWTKPGTVLRWVSLPDTLQVRVRELVRDIPRCRVYILVPKAARTQDQAYVPRQGYRGAEDLKRHRLVALAYADAEPELPPDLPDKSMKWDNVYEWLDDPKHPFPKQHTLEICLM